MLLGSRNSFGLEAEIAEVDPERSDLVFGRLCLWAGGGRIGDFSRHTILSVPADFFADVVKYQNKRTDDELCGYERDAVLSHVHEALYGPPTGDEEQALRLEARYRKHCLAPGGGEAFDGALAILIECGSRERLVWRVEQDSSAHEIWLDQGACESVLRAFLNWLKETSGYWPDNIVGN